MKLFVQKELREAYLFAESGGQALHLSAKVGTARLIDHDMGRLYGTASRLGLRQPKILRLGVAGQHVVLQQRPFDRAMVECRALELWEER